MKFDASVLQSNEAMLAERRVLKHRRRNGSVDALECSDGMQDDGDEDTDQSEKSVEKCERVTHEVQK